MSLYGVMRTSTSGMNAQSSRISAVAENVANANTNSYKAVRTEFSSYFIGNTLSDYNSGYVDVESRRMVSTQGTLSATSSMTDLGIQGDGFFVVSNDAGENFLTRAGSFVPDADGRLVNNNGFTLLGYPLTGAAGGIVVNGFAGLVPISVDSIELSASATTSGKLQTNLPSTASVVAPADLPSANAATATYTAKTSVVVYGNLGEEILLDVYMSKTAVGQWEVAVYDHAQAGANGFPYAAGPLSTVGLTFDPSDGTLDASSPDSISIAVPGGATVDLDLSKTTQLASVFSVQDADVNGNKASAADLVEIAADGTVFVAFDDGTRRAIYRIPLATAPSPDNLTAENGNAYSVNSRSGDFWIGFPGTPGLGDIVSGVLEQSTADIASEFTEMIDAQRSYTANSKVFQTGAELMDVLVNLKR